MLKYKQNDLLQNKGRLRSIWKKITANST